MNDEIKIALLTLLSTILFLIGFILAVYYLIGPIADLGRRLDVLQHDVSVLENKIDEISF